MSKDLVSIGELHKRLSSKEFVHLTKDQILKDAEGLLNDVPVFEPDFNGDVHEQFILFLSGILEELTKSDTSRLMQFIYRVDLNENQFHDSVYGGDLDQLAQLIIRREAQKVFFKNYFR